MLDGVAEDFGGFGVEEDVEVVKAAFRAHDSLDSKTIPLERLVEVLVNLDPSLEQQQHSLKSMLEHPSISNGIDVRYEDFVHYVASAADKSNETNVASIYRTTVVKEPSGTMRKSIWEDKEELAKIMAQRERRVSISAAKIDNSAMENYQKPFYEKDEEAKQLIFDKMTNHPKLSVLFGHLAQDAMEDVANAFYEKHFADAAEVIRQGEKGDCLYIIAEGNVEIYVARPDVDGELNLNNRGGHVGSFADGYLFGELALMYEAPRAATVVANGPVKTWVLNALDFKMLLITGSTSESVITKYDGWLTNVPLLSVLNHFELANVADVMQSDCFDAGDDIIIQGAEGEDADLFYILEDGQAETFLDGDDGPKCGKRYSALGDYFGEIAVLTGEPRKATVRAAGNGCEVGYLTKEDFFAVLGPLVDKLRSGIGDYPEYANPTGT